MRRPIVIQTILLLCPLRPLVAADAADQPVAVSTFQQSADASAYKGLQAFLGAPLSLPIQQLWKGGGGTSIVTAQDGSVIAFQSMASNKIRRSTDGGVTWGADLEIGPGATYANAIVDESTGDILYVNPAKQWLWRSRDRGLTWTRETITVRPDGFGLVPNTVSAMQPGITLQFGSRKGRLLRPARVQGPKYSNDVEWRPYHYSTAVYSDDGGKSWQTSHPFPVLGTGEAALAELSDGSILYNSREHMSRGNRFMAWSHDGGDLWLDADRSAELPDGPRGDTQRRENLPPVRGRPGRSSLRHPGGRVQSELAVGRPRTSQSVGQTHRTKMVKATRTRSLRRTGGWRAPSLRGHVRSVVQFAERPEPCAQ